LRGSDFDGFRSLPILDANIHAGRLRKVEAKFQQVAKRQHQYFPSRIALKYPAAFTIRRLPRLHWIRPVMPRIAEASAAVIWLCLIDAHRTICKPPPSLAGGKSFNAIADV